MEKCKYVLLLERIKKNTGIDTITLSMDKHSIVVDDYSIPECLVMIMFIGGDMEVMYGDNEKVGITKQDLIDFNISDILGTVHTIEPCETTFNQLGYKKGEFLLLPSIGLNKNFSILKHNILKDFRFKELNKEQLINLNELIKEFKPCVVEDTVVYEGNSPLNDYFTKQTLTQLYKK